MLIAGRLLKNNFMIKRILGVLFSLSIMILFLFSSCASRKDIVYLLPDSTKLVTSFELAAPKLQAGDLLSINISASDPKVLTPFNQLGSNLGNRIANDPSRVTSYAIDVDGNIDFPLLGQVKLGGLTRTQAIAKMRSELRAFIVDPTVNINVVNLRVTVLGEVKQPGTFIITNDRITVLEALGMAGDLTINGVRKNVLVIREENGSKKEYRLDLTKREMLNSEAYYLAQNDVVYVEPNGARMQASKHSSNTSVFVSVASLLITVISVLTR